MRRLFYRREINFRTDNFTVVKGLRVRRVLYRRDMPVRTVNFTVVTRCWGKINVKSVKWRPTVVLPS